MSVRDIEVPARMRGLERDRRGYPVPVVVLRDDQGCPHFTINDHRKVAAMARANACHICGDRLGAHKWFVGGPCAALHARGAYNDGPAHRECAEYALKACPYLSRPGGWSKRIDARTIKPGALNRTVLLHDTTMFPDQPVVFAMGDCAGYELLTGGANRFRPIRPWREVLFWRGGELIASQDAKTMIEADPNLPVPFSEIAGWWR